YSTPPSSIPTATPGTPSRAIPASTNPINSGNRRSLIRPAPPDEGFAAALGVAGGTCVVVGARTGVGDGAGLGLGSGVGGGAAGADVGGRGVAQAASPIDAAGIANRRNRRRPSRLLRANRIHSLPAAV